MTTPSTGPRTEAGKARSSLNALKTGIYSQSIILPGESLEDYQQLSAEYYARFSPGTPELRDQLDLVITNAWFLRRYARVLTEVFIRGMEHISKPSQAAPLGQAFFGMDAKFSRLQRIVTATQRNFSLALKEVERLHQLQPAPQPPQPEAITPPEEFVPSTPVEAPPPGPRTRGGIHLLERHDRFLSEKEKASESECPYCFPENLNPSRPERV